MPAAARKRQPAPHLLVPPRSRPFARDGLGGRVWAFALGVALGFAAVPFVHLGRPGLAVLAGALALALAGAVWWVPWERLPRRAAVVPPLGLVVVVFLLREATGGLSNPVDFEALLLIAVLWVALHGDRVDVVLVVGTAAASLAASAALPGGGDDDWPKAVLWPAVTLIVGLHTQGLVRQVTIASGHDRLTGLANRARWDDELVREVARAHRSAEPLSVAVFDIDHFKAINDARGHRAGDGVLRDAAAAWASQLRAGDLLARHGGEEFALLLPGVELDAARQAVERIRHRTPHGVTCSAGVAQLRHDDSSASLVARADDALYRAKRTGRDRTCAA